MRLTKVSRALTIRRPIKWKLMGLSLKLSQAQTHSLHYTNPTCPSPSKTLQTVHRPPIKIMKKKSGPVSKGLLFFLKTSLWAYYWVNISSHHPSMISLQQNTEPHKAITKMTTSLQRQRLLTSPAEPNKLALLERARAWEPAHRSRTRIHGSKSRSHCSFLSRDLGRRRSFETAMSGAFI